MISSWKCFFIIVLKVLLVTTDQNYEVSPRPSFPDDVKDICNLQHDKGTCSGHYLQWYYNSMYNDCLLFVYRGCGGNNNRFDYFYLCYNLCVKKDFKGVTAVDDVPPTSDQTIYTRRFNPNSEVETTDSRRNTNAGFCNQPKNSGYCTGRSSDYDIRWYYDYSTNSCKMFSYYGCGGNYNRFNSHHVCKQQCVRDAPNDEITIDFLQPTDDQMSTSDYILPDIESVSWNPDIGTTDWKTDVRTIGWKDLDEEKTGAVDVSFHSAWPRDNFVGFIFAIIFAVAVLLLARIAIFRYQQSKQDIQLPRSNNGAEQTSSSDGDSSPARLSVCVISLSKAVQQRTDESTVVDELPDYDQTSSQAQPFLGASPPPAYFPSYPPPYGP